MLDPEQNATFRDNYLDLPFDLSDVMFIATANTLDTIPHPLLDRMEVIRLSGYTEDEKVEIAKRYIIPKSLKKSGLDKTHVRYDRSALKAIALGYAREAGMRHYEQLIDRIHRKVAKKLRSTRRKSCPSRSPNLAWRFILSAHRLKMKRPKDHPSRYGGGLGMDGLWR